MNNHLKAILVLPTLALTGLVLQAAPKNIPAQLPRPDGQPGDATKPVKVYLLAGQSNMNGMGDLAGARPPYPSVFLSADPAIIPGSMPIGGSALAAHEVYQSADPKARVVPVAQVAYPAGMEHWFAVDFEARKAGWKSGAAPFGQLDDKVTYPDWMPRRPAAPKTVCERDVLLLRQSFDLPPLKEGHRYRVRIDGSAHPNMGEGYAIYIHGRLLAESKSGIVAWRREGGRPRGGHVWTDFRDAFQGGSVTLAVSSFPMDNKPTDRLLPHRAHLGVWMEEMKCPPLE